MSFNQNKNVNRENYVPSEQETPWYVPTSDILTTKVTGGSRYFLRVFTVTKASCVSLI